MTQIPPNIVIPQKFVIQKCVRPIKNGPIKFCKIPNTILLLVGECATDDDCNSNAQCTDDDGFYRCKCKDGFFDVDGNATQCGKYSRCI